MNHLKRSNIPEINKAGNDWLRANVLAKFTNKWNVVLLSEVAPAFIKILSYSHNQSTVAGAKIQSGEQNRSIQIDLLQKICKQSYNAQKLQNLVWIELVGVTVRD